MKAKKCFRTLVLGISICALSTGVALADTGENGASLANPGVDGEIVVMPIIIPQEMVEEQRRIDAYLQEHRDEIERLGFTITHTDPMPTYVEIGIIPFKQEYVNYLYDLFGRDKIKVIDGYLVVPPVPEAVSPEEQVTIQIMADPDAPVSAASAQVTAKDTPAPKALTSTATEKSAENATDSHLSATTLGTTDFAADSVAANEDQGAEVAELLVTTAAQESSETSSTSGISPLIYGAGAIVLLGGVGLGVRKLKMSER